MANIVIGASLGFAGAGVVIATGGVIAGAVGGIGSAYLGATALQGFAIGALAVDTSAFFILPLFCIELPSIEFENPEPVKVN